MIERFQLPWSRDKIDVIAAIGGIFLGIGISCLNLIYSNAYLITLGPMIVIVCLVYLTFRRKLLSSPVDDNAAHPRAARVANILFWISLTASTYSLHTEPLHRPLIYFILISVAASMIALQILYSRGSGSMWLILLQILLISLSVRASAFFVFPTLPGSDPWAHVEYVKDFMHLGRIESTRGWITYLYYPITHLNAATMNIITEVDWKTTMFLGISLPLMLSTVFVFLIGQSLGNARVGLLAALLVSLGDFHLQWSIQPGSTTFGLTLFTIILFLLIRDRGGIRILPIALIILLLLTMVITHTMSAFVMFCLLAFLLIGIYLYRFLYKERVALDPSVVVFGLTAMFAVAMLTYWIHAGYMEGRTFFESIIWGLYRSLTEEAGFLARTPAPGGLDPVLNIAGFVLLYLCATLGCLLWLSRSQQTRTRVSLVITLVLLNAFAFSFPLFGMRHIVPYRWFSFIYVILAVVAAAAMFSVVRNIKHRNVGNLVLACIIAIISFFMITNDISNMDSPVYAAELNQRIVYSASEMAIATKVNTVYEGTIITDLQFGARVLGTYLGRNNVSSNMLSEEALNSGLVIWRHVMASRPVQAPRQLILLTQAFEERLGNSHNLIYSNNTSKAFLAKGK